MKNYILIISIHADSALAPGYRDWGGTNVYMRELMLGLSKLHIPFVFVTRKVFPELPDMEKLSENAFIYRIISGKEELIDKNLLKNYHKEHFNAIVNIIDKIGCKPVVIHSVYWNSGRLALDLSRLYDIKFVHSVISNNLGRINRGAKEYCIGRSQYEKEVFENAYLILAVSKDEKNDLIKYYGISQNKIIVAGQEVNNAFLFPCHDINGFPKIYSKITDKYQKNIALRENVLPESSGNWWNYKAFTYMGRLSYNKGVPYIIMAWYKIYQDYQNDCPPLWIIGGSLDEIEKIRKQLHVDNLETLEKKQKIVWWGYLDENGISTLLLKTMVVIMHSMYEPGGRVAVEAMSEGIPVITTNRGFGADYIHDWENGFCVEYGDVYALRKKMEYFVRQPLLANTLGMAAKKCAKDIIAEWDFLYSHCNAYIEAGFPHERFIQDTNSDVDSSEHNYTRKRHINIYPYASHELDDDFIESYANNTLNHVLNINELVYSDSTSRLWEIETKDKKYILKYFRTRLSLNALYNPFQKDIWVRRGDHQQETEVYFDKILNYNHIIDVDYKHNLILMEKYPLVEFKNPEYDLPLIIDTLNMLKRVIRPEQRNLYLNLEWPECYDLESISVFLEHFSKTFPKMYGIDASCIQSTYLGWKMLPIILDFNSIYLNADWVKLLKDRFIPLFQDISRSEEKLPVTLINGDIKESHFIVNGNHIETIDNEKASIGRVGYDIAKTLSIFHKKGYDWKTLISSIPNSYIPKELLISRIIYNLIYENLVDSIVKNNSLISAEEIENLYALL
ncbi:MAG: glycosyltransferase family 1 protein [Lachnospiraceae bacterium]|jgi:Glycosyltransferase|nr:glycosyltransferase family 1 protein [Lachnospiraceae bacterium]